VRNKFYTLRGNDCPLAALQNGFHSQAGRGEWKNTLSLPEIEIRSSSIEPASVLTDDFPLLSFIVNLICLP
jgi:hypothetical protein